MLHYRSAVMIVLPKIHFLTLLLIYLGSQVQSNATDHRYSDGDTVPFYANKVGPFSNAQYVTYSVLKSDDTS